MSPTLIFLMSPFKWFAIWVWNYPSVTEGLWLSELASAHLRELLLEGEGWLEKTSPSARAPVEQHFQPWAGVNVARPLRSGKDDASFIYPLDAELASSVLRC